MKNTSQSSCCKHGQLSRDCNICELEEDQRLLETGGIIELSMRNVTVDSFVREKEARISSLTEELERWRETAVFFKACDDNVCNCVLHTTAREAYQKAVGDT